MLYGYPNHDGVIQATLETAGAAPTGYIPIDSHDKIGWRYIDGSFLQTGIGAEMMSGFAQSLLCVC